MPRVEPVTSAVLPVRSRSMRYPRSIFLSALYLAGGTTKMFHAVAAPAMPSEEPPRGDHHALAIGGMGFIHASHFSSFQSPVSQMPMKPDRLASSSEVRPDDHGSSGVSGAG